MIFLVVDIFSVVFQFLLLFPENKRRCDWYVIFIFFLENKGRCDCYVIFIFVSRKKTKEGVIGVAASVSDCCSQQIRKTLIGHFPLHRHFCCFVLFLSYFQSNCQLQDDPSFTKSDIGLLCCSLLLNLLDIKWVFTIKCSINTTFTK